MKHVVETFALPKFLGELKVANASKAIRIIVLRPVSPQVMSLDASALPFFYCILPIPSPTSLPEKFNVIVPMNQIILLLSGKETSQCSHKFESAGSCDCHIDFIIWNSLFLLL